MEKGSVPVISSRVKAKGSIPQEIARGVLDSVQPQIRFCYDRELEASPRLKGRITSQLMVQPSGAVAKERITESTLGSERVETCVLRVLKRMRFPAGLALEPAPVTYYWNFKTDRA